MSETFKAYIGILFVGLIQFCILSNKLDELEKKNDALKGNKNEKNDCY